MFKRFIYGLIKKISFLMFAILHQPASMNSLNLFIIVIDCLRFNLRLVTVTDLWI